MPFIPILINPAAVNTSDKPMKGHFLPRKSKLVFLNNSIEPVTAGLECQTPACRQKFPPVASPRSRIHKTNTQNEQNDLGYHKPGRPNHSNAKRYCPLLPAQLPIEDGAGNKH